MKLVTESFTSEEFIAMPFEERKQRLLGMASDYEEVARTLRNGVARAERLQESPSGESN